MGLGRLLSRRRVPRQTKGMRKMPMTVLRVLRVTVEGEKELNGLPRTSAGSSAAIAM